MRRSTLAVVFLATAAPALAGCGQRQSLYLDSGRAESADLRPQVQPKGAATAAPAAAQPAPPKPARGD